MAAYLIARIQSEDRERLAAYRAATPAIIRQFGGRYIARGGATATLEGATESRRIVIIEFPDLATVQVFYHSAEYARVRALRENLAVAEMIAVDGIDSTQL